MNQSLRTTRILKDYVRSEHVAPSLLKQLGIWLTNAVLFVTIMSVVVFTFVGFLVGR